MHIHRSPTCRQTGLAKVDGYRIINTILLNLYTIGGHMALKEINPKSKWKEHGGAAFVIAHPDDEGLIGWKTMQCLC